MDLQLRGPESLETPGKQDENLIFPNADKRPGQEAPACPLALGDFKLLFSLC